MEEQKLPKLCVNILGFNEKHHLHNALTSVQEQDYPNLEVTYIDNASTDGSEDYVRANFPHIKVIQTHENRHYGPAHNKGLAGTQSELVSFLNSDLKLKPNYFSELVKAILKDEKIAGAQGKMLRPEPNAQGKYIFDGTGLTINRMRVVKDRGQLQVDDGQYDTPEEVFAICGAAPVYRRAALEDIAIDGEVMDEDITAFFDDSDMGWRLRHQGWKIWYQPTAVLYHERGVGQSPSGYKNLFALAKFRKSFSVRTKQLSWKNKIYIVLKNDFGKTLRRDWPYILMREIATFGFILIFETSTLKILPTVFKQLPNIFRKRKIIKSRSVLGDENIDRFILKTNNL
ncbi:MAG TPA: glycosyltransferase family 2 protein [Patescibacteria group bacterium]|nr:glycosyltransferase family 2 protein [Patescibacteria group bacterium]